MAPEANVLINTEIGTEIDVFKELKKIEGVKEARLVYGVYDITLKVEAPTIDVLKETLDRKVRKVDKIRSTLTLITIEDPKPFIKDELLPANSPDLKTPEKCAFEKGISFYEISQKEGAVKMESVLNSLNTIRMSGAAINDFMSGYFGKKIPKEEHTSDGRNIVNVDYCSQVCRLFDCGINEHPDNPKYKSKDK